MKKTRTFFSPRQLFAAGFHRFLEAIILAKTGLFFPGRILLRAAFVLAILYSLLTGSLLSGTVQAQQVTKNGKDGWGNYRYTGELSTTGARSGKGTCIWENKMKVEGEWSDDRPSGRCIITDSFRIVKKTNLFGVLPGGHSYVYFPDGIRFEGKLDDALFLREGLMKYPDSSYYEGEFKGYSATGKGKMTEPDGRVVEGTFTRGIPDGFCKAVLANGDQFMGFTSNGKRNGYGMERFPDGAISQGNYTDDKRDGFFAINTPENKSETMFWQYAKGKFTGLIAYTNYSGQLLEIGFAVNGKMIDDPALVNRVKVFEQYLEKQFYTFDQEYNQRFDSPANTRTSIKGNRHIAGLEYWRPLIDTIGKASWGEYAITELMQQIAVSYVSKRLWLWTKSFSDGTISSKKYAYTPEIGYTTWYLNTLPEKYKYAYAMCWNEDWQTMQERFSELVNGRGYHMGDYIGKETMTPEKERTKAYPLWPSSTLTIRWVLADSVKKTTGAINQLLLICARGDRPGTKKYTEKLQALNPNEPMIALFKAIDGVDKPDQADDYIEPVHPYYPEYCYWRCAIANANNKPFEYDHYLKQTNNYRNQLPDWMKEELSVALSQKKQRDEESMKQYQAFLERNKKTNYIGYLNRAAENAYKNQGYNMPPIFSNSGPKTTTNTEGLYIQKHQSAGGGSYYEVNGQRVY